MKTHLSAVWRVVVLASLALAVAAASFAQKPAAAPEKAKPESKPAATAPAPAAPAAPAPGAEGRPRFISPLIAALDRNGDQVLSADEISTAAAVLATLDKNKDGELTGDEVRPSRPGRAGSEGQAPQQGRRDDTQSATGQRPAGQASRNPAFNALDANKDGKVTADEMKNAAAALKTLDKNGDGKLTNDEYGYRRGGTAPGPGQGPGSSADRPPRSSE